MTTRRGYNRKPRSRPSVDDIERYERLMADRQAKNERLAEAAGDRSGNRYRMNSTARAGHRTRNEQKRKSV
jgi:hypothetical protein